MHYKIKLIITPIFMFYSRCKRMIIVFQSKTIPTPFLKSLTGNYIGDEVILINVVLHIELKIMDGRIYD